MEDVLGDSVQACTCMMIDYNSASYDCVANDNISVGGLDWKPMCESIWEPVACDWFSGGFHYYGYWYCADTTVQTCDMCWTDVEAQNHSGYSIVNSTPCDIDTYHSGSETFVSYKYCYEPSTCGCVGESTNTLFVCGNIVNESCTLNCSLGSTSTCFTIGADSIIIDGAGYSITGGGDFEDYGIYAEGRNNVTIKNFNIYNFDVGIHLWDSSNNKIINNTVNLNAWDGIWLGYFSDNNTIINNTANSNNGAGIHLCNSNNNTLTNNTANSNWDGIYLSWPAQNNTLTSNTAKYNQEHSLYIEESSATGNAIDSNTFCSNNQSGGDYYDIYDADNNTFTDNTCNTSNPSGLCATSCGVVPECTPDLTNTSWTLISTSSCLPNDTIQWNYSRTEYDSNYCNETVNVTYYKTNYTSCDYCTPALVNTSWILDSSSSCLPNDTIQWNYSRTEYDSNYCNETENVTYYKTNYTECDFCTPALANTSWILDSSSSCLPNDTIQWNYSRIEYDSNYCNETENVTYYKTNYTFCDYCTPSLVNTSWIPDSTSSCLPNDTIQWNYSKTEYDSNYCNETENVTYYKTNYTSCDFCTPALANTSWSGWYNITGCRANGTILQEKNLTQYDQNFCGEVENQTFFEYQEIQCSGTFCSTDNNCSYNQFCNGINECQNLTCQEFEKAVNHACYHKCDLNRDGIITHDYNDLMQGYKCFLGIENNCNNYYQNWDLIKQEYECFINVQ